MLAAEIEAAVEGKLRRLRAEPSRSLRVRLGLVGMEMAAEG